MEGGVDNFHRNNIIKLSYLFISSLEHRPAILRYESLYLVQIRISVNSAISF